MYFFIILSKKNTDGLAYIPIRINWIILPVGLMYCDQFQQSTNYISLIKFCSIFENNNVINLYVKLLLAIISKSKIDVFRNLYINIHNDRKIEFTPFDCSTLYIHLFYQKIIFVEQILNFSFNWQILPVNFF